MLVRWLFGGHDSTYSLRVVQFVLYSTALGALCLSLDSTPEQQQASNQTKASVLLLWHRAFLLRVHKNYGSSSFHCADRSVAGLFDQRSEEDPPSAGRSLLQ